MKVNSLVVNLIVGGYKFSIFKDDIEKHPGSLFEQILNDNSVVTSTIIERDGSLFKYVNAFLVNGQLPRDQHGALMLNDTMLAKLTVEAEFYRLPALQAECNQKTSHLSAYIKMKELVHNIDSFNRQNRMEVEYESSKSPLTKAVRAALEPACATNESYFVNNTQFKKDFWTVQNLFIVAKADNPDLQEGSSFEIAASKLDASAFDSSIGLRGCSERSGFADTNVTYQPVKVWVDTVSGPSRECVGTEKVCLSAQEARKIGTLIEVLYQYYEGGHIYVNDESMHNIIPRDHNCIAVHANCTYKMDRVTSGTRISVVFDMMATARKKKPVSEYDEYEARKSDHIWYSDYSGEDRVCFQTTIPSKAGQQVLCEVREELETDDFLFIALQHVYPENANSHSHLLGGDRALHDLLAEAYDVQVVAVTVHHQISGLSDKFDILHATLFAPDIVSAHITSDGENSTTCNGRKRRKIIAKLFLPHELQEEHVMHYAQSTEYMEQQNHDSVYLVSALQVTKRQKVVV